MNEKYDIVGDIHGHAAKLQRLLRQLGYEERDGIYRHASRQLIFVGDFIDRGPEIRRTLQIARAMVDAGTARAVMGNHELTRSSITQKDPTESGCDLTKRSILTSIGPRGSNRTV